MKNTIYLFLILTKLIFCTNELTLNYKEDQPLLGSGHYLKIGKIPLGTYENTIGYFSTVDIDGENLEIKNDLKAIVIKKNQEILKNQELKWDNNYFEIGEIDLDGLVLKLRWDNLNKDRIEVMIEKWDFQKKNYNIEIEYQYKDILEKMNLNINMPTFNPNIYLDVDSNNTIFKKQEYGKNTLILEKIKLNDYDMSIFENSFKVKLNSILNIENQGYLNTVNLIPLIEKYPGVYIEENNINDIFENSKEIAIAIKLPQDLNYNDNYKILGNLLEINYKNNKKEMLEKVVILAGKNKIKRVIALENEILNQKLFLNDNNMLLEKIGTNLEKYKNLKLKVGDQERLIDQNGNSESILTPLGFLQMENGKVILLPNENIKITQGKELKFEILNLENQVVEEYLLKMYIKFNMNSPINKTLEVDPEKPIEKEENKTSEIELEKPAEIKEEI